MPIIFKNNNRLLPSNSRAADVAKSTIDRLIPVQRLRAHNAYVPQGYEAIVYHRLSSGLKCACRSKVAALMTRLDKEGNGDQGFINELLTGGGEFGVRPYGQRAADQMGKTLNDGTIFPSEAVQLAAQSTSLFSISQDTVAIPPINSNLPAKYETDMDFQPPQMIGTPLDKWTSDPDSNGFTIVPDGVGPNGPVGEDDVFVEILPDAYDGLGLGITDRSCPICMGTSYVGGFSIYNGWRKIFNFQWPNADLGVGTVNTELFVPSVSGGTYATFQVIFPNHVIGVDALRCWNDTQVIPATFLVDNTVLKSEYDLIEYCDGTPHSLSIHFKQPTEFTHVEVQLNQSEENAYLDFPKMQKAGVQNVMESMQDFQLMVSPIVPLIRANDVVAESTYGKVLLVKNSNWSNDKHWAILGWECDARVVQPVEIYNLLPRRRPIHSPRSPAFVQHNFSRD